MFERTYILELSILQFYFFINCYAGTYLTTGSGDRGQSCFTAIADLHDINKVPSSETYGFSSSYVWMWELDSKESWVQKNWCFELWCWRRLLRIPWTERRSSQSILKEISPEYSLEGLMLKLKRQYFGYLMGRTDSFEKTLMLGKIEGGRRRGRQRMR